MSTNYRLEQLYIPTSYMEALEAIAQKEGSSPEELIVGAIYSYLGMDESGNFPVDHVADFIATGGSFMIKGFVGFLEYENKALSEINMETVQAYVSAMYELRESLPVRRLNVEAISPFTHFLVDKGVLSEALPPMTVKTEKEIRFVN